MKKRRLLCAKSLVTLSALMLLASPHVAGAQAGAVSGIVIDAASERPVSNAAVGVMGPAGKGAVTDGFGRFTITGLSGTTVVLSVRLIGYRPATDTVRVGDNNIRVGLSERLVELNAMVVTGTAGGAEVRELGTSVAQVKVSDLMQQAPIPTVSALLSGNAPGVDVINTSGQVGAGPQIRVRGVGTFSLSSTPLIYVDGIRVDNGQTGIVSRFDDIEPDEIESMEVLKGPAAATLYGTEAARGVINIITKHGTPGATKYNFSVQSGPSWFQDAAGRFQTNYWLNPVTDSLWSLNGVKEYAAMGKSLFTTGGTNNYSANASGGSGIFRYFVSGEWNAATGIVTANGRQQKAARTNLSIVPSSQVDIETSVGYITSHTNLAGEGGSAGPMWMEFAEPQRTVAACPYLFNPVPAYCGLENGSIVGPPEQYLQTQRTQDVNRTTASVSIKYDPYTWLSNRLLIGTDYTLENVGQYLPYQVGDSVIIHFLGASFDGSQSITAQQTIYNTYDFSSSVHFDLSPRVNEKSSIGVQYYTNTQTAVSASGSHFPSPGLSTLNATGTKGAPTSSLTGENTLGAYLQQEFSLDNSLFLTGAYRVDNNSAFGSQVHFTTYPKVSVSWVASDVAKVRTILPAFVDELRLRGAYGGSGQQPPVNTAVQTVTPAAGPNSGTVLTNNTIGNPDLKPERALGAELGFEASLWKDRIGIDLTLFSDVIHDAILANTVAPSTGYGASTQFQNAGQINKHGFELALRGDIFTRRDYAWNMQVNLAATTSKIVRIGAGADTIIDVTPSTAVSTVGDVFHVVGYSPFDLFTYRVVSATYNPATNKAINPMCDDAHGGTIPCFKPGTSTIQAPLVYAGHSIPTTTASWINTLRYKQFRLYVKVDISAGDRKTNTNTEQECQQFGDCLYAIYGAKYNPATVFQAQDGTGQFQYYFINTSAYTKLREVSLTYDAPESIARRVLHAKAMSVTVSGRNLAMLTHYTGLDPESSVSGTTGSSNNIGIDQTEYPLLAQVLFSLRLTY